MRCREILFSDCDQIVTLLTEGFDRDRSYWTRAIHMLAQHATPTGYPQFGYLLEDREAVVGVLLLIYTQVGSGNQAQIRCNVSSWYVQPRYRGYATILSKRATNLPNVAYFNVSPAPHTWPMLEATGFRRFATGRFIAAPALSRKSARANVFPIAGETLALADLPSAEGVLLIDHARYGCKSLLCESANGEHPFVFGLRRRHGVMPMAHLIYARSLADFVRMAGPLGRHLLLCGYPLVVLDADAAIPGLLGRFFQGRPRFFKGSPLGLGDLAYSEQAMFGY